MNKEKSHKVVVAYLKKSYSIEHTFEEDIPVKVSGVMKKDFKLENLKVFIGKKDITKKIDSIKDLHGEVYDDFVEKTQNSIIFIRKEKGQEITIDHELPLEVEVSGSYDPGEKGSRWEPPVPESLEDIEVFFKDIDITSEIPEKFIEFFKDELLERYIEDHEPPERDPHD